MRRRRQPTALAEWGGRVRTVTRERRAASRRVRSRSSEHAQAGGARYHYHFGCCSPISGCYNSVRNTNIYKFYHTSITPNVPVITSLGASVVDVYFRSEQRDRERRTADESHSSGNVPESRAYLTSLPSERVVEWMSVETNRRIPVERRSIETIQRPLE